MGRFRDAITGLFTTREHAQANPATTVRESTPPVPPFPRPIRPLSEADLMRVQQAALQGAIEASKQLRTAHDHALSRGVLAPSSWTAAGRTTSGHIVAVTVRIEE